MVCSHWCRLTSALTSGRQLLTIKAEIEVFKQLAKQLDAAEAIDFYLDIQEYQVYARDQPSRERAGLRDWSALPANLQRHRQRSISLV